MFIRLVVATLIFALLTSCGIFLPSSNQEQSESIDEISLYKGEKKIQVSDSDQFLIIEELFGRDYNFYESNLKIARTDRIGDEIIEEIDTRLPKSKWRLKSDWYGTRFQQSEWQSGDLNLFIIVYDNLTSADIKDFNRMYGIQDLEPGDTLTLSFTIDYSQTKPDLTATFEAEQYQITETAYSESRELTSIAADITSTAYMDNQIREATAEAMVQEKQATETANAIAATASKEAMFASQTAAVTPIPTIDQNPPLLLPFEDNFDKGLRPEWRVLSDEQPVIIDGYMTAVDGGEAIITLGNGLLNNYSIEFDLSHPDYFFMGWEEIQIYFTPTLMLEIHDSEVMWTQYIEEDWELVSEHDIKLVDGKETIRTKFIRNGDNYQIVQNEKVVNSIKFGSTAGSPISIRVKTNLFTIDNLLIESN